MTPARHSRSPIHRVLVKFGLVLVVAVVGFVAVAFAQPPTTSRTSDTTLALRVRQALDNHPALRPHQLNLLVNVIDGVVVIGGPVPDTKLSGTIEEAAKAVEGVARVKVSVWQQSAPRSDPLAAKLDDRLNPKPVVPTTPAVSLGVPTEPQPPKPDPRPKADVTARKTDLPEPSPNVLQPPVSSAERTSRAPHVRPPGAEPPEYTPIPATNLPTEPIAEPRPTNATPVRAAPPREPERESDAWKRDPRFAGLTVDVRNGMAIIGGRAKTQAVAWELAEQVRNWPTVERVVVGKVEVMR